MIEMSPDISTTIVKLSTDKPVRKTPYQVKGVFIKKHPGEPITPMLDGTYRKKFSYPRVQVKILDEQIYIIGINEGVQPVLSIPKKIKELNFGNITFAINDYEIKNLEQQFIPSGTIIKYSFLTPWAALNHVTGSKYRSTPHKKKAAFLNKLLGNNLIFLAKEMGVSMRKGVYVKVKIPDLHPKSIDVNKWKAFNGEFKTNILLPNYIGLGNGITRGYGTIKGPLNFDMISLDKELSEQETKDMDLILPNDSKKQKKKAKSKKVGFDKINSYRKGKNTRSSKKNKKRYNLTKKSNVNRSIKNNTNRIFSEDFDIIADGNTIESEKNSDFQDDQRFNTEKHHKKQHKF
tara:strand:+ start:5345 stop:6385 length:1041 start_codon:yes stop_codon:yes gene_type:complete